MATQKRTITGLIPGHATHTRTAETYMGALLDAVSLDDWREVVQSTVKLAKGGDPQARAWLSNFLIGRPESTAPTPISVVVNQLQGTNQVLDKLTHHQFIDARFHDSDDDVKADIRAKLAIELQHKMQQANATE